MLGKRVSAWVVLAAGTGYWLGGQAAFGSSLDIGFTHTFAGEPVVWHESAHASDSGATLTLSRLDYLVCDVQLEYDTTTTAFATRYFLVNAADGKTTLSFDQVPAGKLKSITFTIGVDEAANHADPAKWPRGHALNVLENNLHWDWKGGYIFLAAEGRVVGGQRAAFLYHLGGDRYRRTVTVPIPTHAAPQTIEVEFDVSRLFGNGSGISVAGKENVTHSADGDLIAPRLAANLPRCFTVKSTR